MTPERGSDREALSRARARRRPIVGVLARACFDDEAMRRNVESMLAESESDDGFLAEPASRCRAELTTSSPQPWRAPWRISAARCSAGRAWARCTSADRSSGATSQSKSASCVHEPTGSPRTLQREARMLASLNHPTFAGSGTRESNSIRFLISSSSRANTRGQTRRLAESTPERRRTAAR